MTDKTQPAASTEVSQDTAASPVTTPTTEITTPQAETPAGEQPQVAEGDQDGEQKQSTWKEKRAERNRQRWQEFKRKNEEFPRQLESLRRDVERLKSGDPPDFSKFVDPNEELVERTAHRIRQDQAREAEARYQAEEQRVAHEHQRALAAAWEETVEAAREAMPDFDQVFNPDVPVHSRAVRHIAESDVGAEIAYLLGKEPLTAQRLYQLFDQNPGRALIEFGKLEARVSKPSPKKTSTAPAPAAVISGGQNPVAFDANKASVDDMEAYLRKSGIIR